MATTEVSVIREKVKQARSAELLSTAKEVAVAFVKNPAAAGLLALGVNQLLYKAGVWDARPSRDGKFYTYKTNWGFDTNGGWHIDLGAREWVQSDPEQIAADNATAIAAMIIGATLAYSAKGLVALSTGQG